MLSYKSKVRRCSTLGLGAFILGLVFYLLLYSDTWLPSMHIQQHYLLSANYGFHDEEWKKGYIQNNISSKAATFSSKMRINKLSSSLQNIFNVQKKIQTKYLSNSNTRKLQDLIKHFFSKPQNVAGINCAALFVGDVREQLRAVKLMLNLRLPTSTKAYRHMTRNCTNFKQYRRYITYTLSKEEEEFPIAYSIVTYKDVEQTERLLRAIYRPQHAYCIHIDIKSKPDYRQAIQSIANCFDNVFLSSRSVDVQWATFTVLEADLICMEDLWKYKKWKYFINLTGQEFPLRTNYELMRILKIYKGANDVGGTIKRADKSRWTNAGKPPHGIRPVKGSVHIAVNRDFIDYVLHNKTAKDFLDWTKLTMVPDETFFSTMNHNPQLGIPGSYKGEPERNVRKPLLTRFKNWESNDVFDWPCKGQNVRNICIFGIGDLPLLASRPEMFANKFYRDYQPYTLDCMEELIYNRTRDEILRKRTFDTKFYESVDFIKNKV